MDNKKWAEQFEKSLRKADLEDYRLENILPYEINLSMDELFHFSLNAISYSYLNRALLHLENLYNSTDSPIEKAMVCALVLVANEKSLNVRFKASGYLFGDLEDDPDFIQISVQEKIGKYRVDFLITFTESVPDFDNKTKTKDGLSIPGVKIETTSLIVECDGHDFHDRTKEQASRDRARDRELKKLGYEVFRYTGSDIWADVYGCATESIDRVTGADKLAKRLSALKDKGSF
jgi:very-short-patch-repair endonuclease